ncbi:uncharacterized protein N7498_010530 [Penicillium cinerascens]|uniref:Uncharacterized protein n=1 Tax=Penicillium cinerascens TaxID=70096 RepID=A0A9W9M6Y0_9EURO|nr:uncharacterized protein N7498_010530 [Penicillium cinerascens]KAJ5191545.1 hypothetical protein N7498_010530 [Penicillium cinerascens]
MVDRESLDSVLNAPDPDRCETSFVRLVYGEWEPGVLDEEELEAFEPLEGCTLGDVGLMRVPYGEAEFTGFVYMRNADVWDLFYSRPPRIQSLAAF